MRWKWRQLNKNKLRTGLSFWAKVLMGLKKLLITWTMRKCRLTGMKTHTLMTRNFTARGQTLWSQLYQMSSLKNWSKKSYLTSKVSALSRKFKGLMCTLRVQSVSQVSKRLLNTLEWTARNFLTLKELLESSISCRKTFCHSLCCMQKIKNSLFLHSCCLCNWLSHSHLIALLSLKSN